MAEERFCFCTESQKVIWKEADAIPEIDITESTVVEEFKSKDLAESFIRKWLEDRSARATWADVRPIEECGKCGKDFETKRRHLAIALTREIGDPATADCELDCWYVARFCPECAAVAQN